jgi:hypothetical protein
MLMGNFSEHDAAVQSKSHSEKSECLASYFKTESDAAYKADDVLMLKDGENEDLAFETPVHATRKPAALVQDGSAEKAAGSDVAKAKAANIVGSSGASGGASSHGVKHAKPSPGTPASKRTRVVYDDTDAVPP